MSIHFAASRRFPGSVPARYLTAPRAMQAANDNYDQAAALLIDNPLLRATLEHFAEFGLAAAAQARGLAEHALQADDAEAYRHWAAVCRLLDRQMAVRLSRNRSTPRPAGKSAHNRPRRA